MSALSDLYAKLGAHPGSWSVLGVPTPDFGVTEAVGGSNILPTNVQNVASNVVKSATNGMVNIGSGASGASTLNSGKVLAAETVAPGNPGGYPVVTGGGPDASGGTGAGTGAGAGAGTGSNPNDPALADSAYALAQQRIQNIFNYDKAQADMERTNAVNRFNDILSAVDAFKKQAQTQFTNAGQEITNTASDLLHGNATNAADLVGKATGQARSLGLGLSSRLNLGQGLMQNLESTQGNTMAKKGEQDRANQVQLDQRNDTGDAQVRDATTAEQNTLAAADQLDRKSVADYGTNESQAGLDFGNMLNNIVNYNRSLQAMTPVDSGSLTAYNPDMSGIVNTINSVISGLPTTTTASEAPATLASSNSLTDIMKRLGLYQGNTSL